MPDVGDLIDERYQLLEVVGVGGTATVYKAKDTRLGRLVAVKIITYNNFFETPQIIRKRFEREINLLSQLQHPNIVSIWDYVEHNGSPHFVMDYFPNGTLKNKLERLDEPIPWQEAIQILLPVAHGLSYAHKQGIIHRDIKPSNILLSASGVPVLSDFGIAKSLESIDGFTTKTGMLIGSHYYASPEQLHDTSSVDARTDIFSLGIVFYEMLTGYLPSNNNFNEPLKNPQEYIPNLPKELYRILSNALAENPKKRYQNMEDFILALENLLRTNGVFVNPIHTDITKAKSKKNRLSIARKVLIFATIFAALITVIGFMTPTLIKTFSPTVWLGNPTSGLDVTTTITSTSATPTKNPTQSAGLTLAEEISLPSGILMRLVPAGEFTMGSNEMVDEKPIHTVFLNAFYIDKYEVTNAQYKLCMDAGVCQLPKDFSSNTRTSYFDNPEFKDYPVIYVDWNKARTFCEWRGARLPTEAEWEKAARGTDGRTFPWGETLDCEHANYGQGKSDTCVGDTTPIWSYESGQSFYGLYNMAGNVSEWVADWYLYDYYQTLGNVFFNPQGPERGQARVLRGGSWSFITGDVRSANRNGYNESFANDNIGFRCAKDP